MPGRGEHVLACGRRARARSARRSILRRCANPARTSANSASGDGTVDRRRRAAVEPHERRVDLGRGARTRSAATVPDHRRLGVVRDLHRRPRRRPCVAGPGDEALPDLPLHHHEACGSIGGDLLEQPHHDGRRDVVRQVRHARPRAAAPASSASRSTVERVAVHDVDASASPPSASTSSSTGSEVAVELERDDVRARPRAARAVSEPSPGPISSTAVAGPHVGEAHDPAGECWGRRGSAGRALGSGGSPCAASSVTDRRRGQRSAWRRRRYRPRRDPSRLRQARGGLDRGQRT